MQELSIKQQTMMETLAQLCGANIEDVQGAYDKLLGVFSNTKSIKDVKSAHDTMNDDVELAAFATYFADDERSGVVKIVTSSVKAIDAAAKERARVHGLYEFDRAHGNGGLVIGMDEVGRGPLAGPLTIGGVVLDPECEEIQGINDSKQVAAKKREGLNTEIRKNALAYTIQHIQPEEIDEMGMSAALHKAFGNAIADLDAQLNAKGMKADVVLLDGNPLHLDERETNVIKGDANSATIACASLIAKVERDNIMHELAKKYPEYGWEHNAGYGAQDHIDAIKRLGLTEIHRKSFCKNFV